MVLYLVWSEAQFTEVVKFGPPIGVEFSGLQNVTKNREENILISSKNRYLYFDPKILYGVIGNESSYEKNRNFEQICDIFDPRF